MVRVGKVEVYVACEGEKNRKKEEKKKEKKKRKI